MRWSELVEAVGLPEAWALCYAFGGKRFYVSKKIATHVAKLIGEKKADEFCKTFAGEQHHFPSKRCEISEILSQSIRAKSIDRDDEIYQLHKACHWTTNEISSYFGIGVRNVSKIIAAKRTEEKDISHG